MRTMHHHAVTFLSNPCISAWYTSRVPEACRIPIEYVSLHSCGLKCSCCGQGLSDVAWEFQDKYLATASDDFTLRLWEVATGECLRTLTGHTNYVFCCAFNPVKPILVLCSAPAALAVDTCTSP